MELKIKTIIRFLNKIDDSQSCWIWRSSINPDGYGLFWFNGGAVSAHRFSFELLKQEIPNGMQLDHLCRNRACVNPDHLEIVTNQENARRGITGMNNWQNKKTHCLKGHELKEPNLLKNGLRRGWRQCRICHNEWVRTHPYKKQNRGCLSR